MSVVSPVARAISCPCHLLHALSLTLPVTCTTYCTTHFPHCLPLLWTATLHVDLVLTSDGLMIHLPTGLIDWKTGLLMTKVLVQFVVWYSDLCVIYDHCTCVTFVSVYYIRYNTWWYYYYHHAWAIKGYWLLYLGLWNPMTHLLG